MYIQHYLNAQDEYNFKILNLIPWIHLCERQGPISKSSTPPQGTYQGEDLALHPSPQLLLSPRWEALQWLHRNQQCIKGKRKRTFGRESGGSYKGKGIWDSGMGRAGKRRPTAYGKVLWSSRMAPWSPLLLWLHWPFARMPCSSFVY